VIASKPRLLYTRKDTMVSSEDVAYQPFQHILYPEVRSLAYERRGEEARWMRLLADVRLVAGLV